MIFFGQLARKHRSHPNVFFDLIRKKESFGLAKIRAGDLPLKRNSIDINEVEAVKQFFRDGVYQTVDYSDRDYYLKGQSWRYSDEQRKIRTWKYFCKRVWMTEDYLKKGELNHPICVYWQPDHNSYVSDVRLDNDDLTGFIDDIEKGSWRVSNGFGRAVFLGFHTKPDDEVTVAAFNTFGKSVDYEKVFEKDEDFIDVFEEGYLLNLSLNWGTAIPYVNASVAKKVNEISSEYHRRIHNWFKNTTITSNLKLSYFNLEPPNSFQRRKVKGTVHLEFTPQLLSKGEDGKYKNPMLDYKLVKACQILPLIDQYNPFYEEDDFSIKYTSI